VVAGQQEDRVREQYGNQVIASAEWRRREVLLTPTPFCRRDTVYQICFLTDYREGKSLEFWSVKPNRAQFAHPSFLLLTISRSDFQIYSASISSRIKLLWPNWSKSL
jgi:hypothetical protein